MTKNPKYAEYLMGEGRRGRLEGGAFIDRAYRENISIVVKGKAESSE